jgi:hypothetical protein
MILRDFLVVFIRGVGEGGPAKFILNHFFIMVNVTHFSFKNDKSVHGNCFFLPGIFKEKRTKPAIL